MEDTIFIAKEDDLIGLDSVDAEGAEVGWGELVNLETSAFKPPDIVVERVDADVIFLTEAFSLLLRVVDSGVFEREGDGG